MANVIKLHSTRLKCDVQYKPGLSLNYPQCSQIKVTAHENIFFYSTIHPKFIDIDIFLRI